MGTLQREPENPFDPMAVAVLVEGERVGYLPGYAARSIRLPAGGAQPVAVQAFAAETSKGVRTEIWVWLGADAPQWSHDAANPPAITAEAKRLARARRVRAMVDADLREGGRRAAQRSTGIVHGIHYLETVEPIKQLKREGRLRDALDLCYIAIEGVEQQHAHDRSTPPPAYTIEAAIIHRKLGEQEQELVVLRRWMALAPEASRVAGPVPDRLRKLEARARTHLPPSPDARP